MWKKLPNALLALSPIVIFGLVAPSDEHATRAPVEDVRYVDMPDEFVHLATWAVDLFAQADMPLPPLRFVYHGDDATSCRGWRGAHRYHDGQSTIHICTSDPGKVTAALVLHEIAHAWSAAELSDERKAAFQALRGWSQWSDHGDTPWHENGTEQAAEILMWGLIDRPVGLVTINDNSCDDLDAGYRSLTGQPPLHGYRDHC